MYYSAILLHRLIAQGHRQLVLKFGQKFEAILGDSASMRHGNETFFDQYLALFENGTSTRYGHIVTMEDE